MVWAVEEFLLITAGRKHAQCLLECCFLGLCLCFWKPLPSPVTRKVHHPSRVAVNVTCKPSPAQTGWGTDRLPPCPMRNEGKWEFEVIPDSISLLPSRRCDPAVLSTAAPCQAFIPPHSALLQSSCWRNSQPFIVTSGPGLSPGMVICVSRGAFHIFPERAVYFLGAGQ